MGEWRPSVIFQICILQGVCISRGPTGAVVNITRSLLKPNLNRDVTLTRQKAAVGMYLITHVSVGSSMENSEHEWYRV